MTYYINQLIVISCSGFNLTYNCTSYFAHSSKHGVMRLFRLQAIIYPRLSAKYCFNRIDLNLSPYIFILRYQNRLTIIPLEIISLRTFG